MFEQPEAEELRKNDRFLSGRGRLRIKRPRVRRKRGMYEEMVQDIVCIGNICSGSDNVCVCFGCAKGNGGSRHHRGRRRPDVGFCGGKAGR